MYDIPISVPTPKFSISFVSEKDGSIVGQEFQPQAVKQVSAVSKNDESGIYSTSSGQWSAFQATFGGNITDHVIESDGKLKLQGQDGKEYWIKGLAIMPGTFKKSGNYDEYIENVVKNNLKNNVTDITQIFGVNADSNVWQNKFSSLGINFYSQDSVNTTHGVQPIGFSDQHVNKGVIAFTDFSKIKETGIRYWNPIMGCRIYVIVSPEVNVGQNYNGQILCVNELTGEYFDCYGKTIDYTGALKNIENEYNKKEYVRIQDINLDDYKHKKGATHNKYVEAGVEVSPTLVDSLGRYYDFVGAEYVCDFEPTESGVPEVGWESYIMDTQKRSVAQVASGKQPYLTQPDSSVYNQQGMVYDSSTKRVLGQLLESGDENSKRDGNIIYWSKPYYKSDGEFDKFYSGPSLITVQTDTYIKKHEVVTYDLWLEHPNTSSDGTKTIPVYRAVYRPRVDVDVVYYDEATGQPLYSNKTFPDNNYSAMPSIIKYGKTYYTHKISYRENTTLSDDIANTSVPVMTESDKNITDGVDLKIDASEEIINRGSYIVRVACGTTPLPITNITGEKTFIIPAQYLVKHFDWDMSVKGHTDKKDDIKATHHYTTTNSKGVTSSHQHDYYVEKFDWKKNTFTWDKQLNLILTPSSNPDYLLADRGNTINNLTRLNNGGNTSFSANSEDVNGNLNLDFSSTRLAITDHWPLLAKYMGEPNTSAINYLNSHSMSGLTTAGLTPNTKYNSETGSKSFNWLVRLFGSDNGYHYSSTYGGHDSKCGGSPKSLTTKTANGIKNSSNATKGNNEGTIVAEPTIVAKKLDKSEAKACTVSGDINTKELIYSATPKDSAGNPVSLDFYPAYKMLLGQENGNDIPIYLLGKEQRHLVPVNVAVVTADPTQAVTDMSTTWSRDLADQGKKVMKSGSVIEGKNTAPLKIKLTSYVVVPKEGYVENADAVRNSQKQYHNTMINSIKETTNYNLLTNLPESFNDNAPAEWKRQNNYKVAGDNIIKSRIPNLNCTITPGATTESKISLKEFEEAYSSVGVNNIARLNKQLEKNGWYQEQFDGFEVIKQVTEFSVTFSTVRFVNFIRNGNTDGNLTNYSDLGVAVDNITASKIYGLELGFYEKEFPVFGNKAECKRLTKPEYFHTRGSIYDNRTR